MKKILLILTTFITIITFSSINSYANVSASNFEKNIVVEEKYISELTSIKNQTQILASSSLNAVINKKDKTQLFKDAVYIRTQIRELRVSLSQYQKENSTNEEKNALALGLLNTLNYYNMSLSFLNLFLTTDSVIEENEYLQNYYFSKFSGDQVLLWIKSQF